MLTAAVKWENHSLKYKFELFPNNSNVDKGDHICFFLESTSCMNVYHVNNMVWTCIHTGVKSVHR